MGYAWHDNEGKTKLYPYWKRILKKLFPDPFTTAVNNFIESGARGLGKSEIAVTIAAYLMYRVMCLRNPIDYYGLKPTEKICFAFMNITKTLAEDIANSKFQNTIKLSPWFQAHGTMTGRENIYWQPPEYIQIIVGSQSSHVLGLPIFFAFFDEISFIRNQDIDTAIGGMKTRFLRNGKSPSLLILASSKRSEKSFLEVHMKKKLESEKENVLIIDEPVWNIKPENTYSGKRFNVALGNKFLVSQVIPDEDNLDVWRDKGYKILSVPVEFRPDFLDDIERALCDFAGISSSELSKYISGTAVSAIKDINLKNPFTKDIIEVGNAPDDKQQYYDYFDLSVIPESLKAKPMYIHLDMSVSGDMTGIAGIFVTGKKPPTEGLDQSNDLLFQLGFSVSIKAPKGAQISFEKNKNLIYWLKSQGFKIRGVSSDSFQSVETGQVLTSRGFKYTMISVDRVNPSNHICMPYQYFKSTIYEGRLKIYNSTTLIDEIINLERNINTGKVDHPDGFRKDVCDAVVGAIWNASQHAEEFGYEFGESAISITELNTENDFGFNFENDMLNSYKPKQKPAGIDFGMGPAEEFLPGNGILYW